MRKPLLSSRRREHIAAHERPTHVCKRAGDRWGVAVLHAGQEIHWYPLEDARRAGAELIRLANLAARPGELPETEHE